MKKSKKLITLLSVCCMAMAATALVGCAEDGKDGINGTNGTNGENGAPGKSAYELAVESGFVGTLEEWLESLKAPVEVPHEHEYGEIVTIVAPTGFEKGVGFKTCPVDGSQQIVILDAVAGIVPENPIEISVGETLTVAVNDYEGSNKAERGEKGVMYFKMTTYQGGNIALPTSAANVEYSFYYADTYNDDDKMFSRNVWVDEDAGEPKDVWVKAVFTGDYPAEVEVTGQITAVGKQKNTITLSHGAAAEGETLSVKVYSIWGYEITLSRDDTDLEIQDFDENLTAWVKVDPAEEEFTFEIVGLADEYCVLDASELYMNFPEDGSKDKGGEYFVHIGRQYEYAVTVKNGDTVLAGVGVVAYNPMNGYVSATTDENGVATFLLPETLNENGETVFDWTVNLVGELGFGLAIPENPVALDLATDNGAVEIAPATIEVPTWVAGEKYSPELRANTNQLIGRMTLTAEEAGEYTLTMTSDNAMLAYTDYNLTVNDTMIAIDGPSSGYTTTLNLVEGDNNFTITLLNAPEDGFRVPFEVCLTKATGEVTPSDNEITLDENNQAAVVSAKEYKYIVPEAGAYKITIVSSTAMIDTMLFHNEAEAVSMDYMGYIWLDGYEIVENGADNFVITEKLDADAELTFYFKNYYDEATDIVIQIEKVVNKVTLDANNQATVVDAKEYVYTVPEAGNYKITIVSSTDMENTMLFWSEALATTPDYMGNIVLDGYVYLNEGGNNFVITEKLEANADLTFYFRNYNDTATEIVVQIEKDTSNDPVKLQERVQMNKEYSFAAEAGVTYYLYASTATGMGGMSAVICKDVDGNTIYDSGAQAYATITVETSGTYTFKVGGVNFYGVNTLTVSTEAPATAA